MTFPRQISLLAFLAFLGLALTGCQPSDPDSPNVKQLTSIAVTPNPLNMVVGGFAALTVTGTLEDNSTYVVNFGTTFASSAPAVATVAADTGYVTAVAPGSATITATNTASGLTATTAVTVTVGGGGGGGGEFQDITFDSAGVIYELVGFGGAEDSTLQLDPTDATNTVARVNRSAGAAVFAGTIVSTGPNATVGKIPLSATSTRMAVRVYSPAAGIKVRLKVEDSSADDPPNPNTRTVETEAVTTRANAWETLIFDFANPVAGTPPLDLGYNYDRLIIFFNFGVDGATAGAQTYYFDDMIFVVGGSSGNTGTCTDACIDFASADVKYDPFEGLVSAEQSDDPVDASNKVAKFVKGPTGQPWAGATVYTVDADKSVPEFDLSGSKIVTLRVYSPMVGMNVRMKLEDAGNNAIYLEKDVLTTKANEWETLSFDFATPVNGVYDPANTYNKVSLFPAFSVTAPPASNVTVYFDELDYTTTGGGGGGGSGATGTCAAPSCTDFSSGGIGFGVFENPGGGTVEVAEDPNDPTNDVVKFVKKTGDNDYFGTTITGLAGPAELTATDKTVTLRVYSPTVGTNFLFKLEGGPGGATVEKDMVTTVAGAWETLSFDLSAGATGTYATVVIFPNGRSKVTTDKTMYIDELKFPASGGGGGGSGSTGTCTDTACIDFSEPGIGFGPFENQGGGTVAIVDDPNDAANKVVQFVKKPGDGDFFGTTITGLGGSVVLTPTAKTVTMRVYSPTVGTNFLLKFEGGTGGPATTEKDVATTVAGAWETLSFVMPDAGTYSVVVLFPNGRSQVAAEKTMYVDELRFPELSTGGGGSGCGSGGEPADMGSGGPQTVVLSSGDSKGIFAAGEGIFAIDYKGSLEPNGNCGSFVEAHSDGTPGGGNIGYFNDELLSTSGQKIEEGGWVAGTSLDPGGIPSFFRYFVLTAPAATFNGSYMGLYANAPNDGTLNVQAFSKIKFRLWGPAEMYQLANFNPVLEVVLSGPKVANCVATGSGGTEITQSFTANQKIGAGSAYTLLLSGFTVKGLCGSDTAGTAVAAVLSNLSRVTVTVPPTSFNFTNANTNSNPVSYSTGVNLGPIGFTNN